MPFVSFSSYLQQRAPLCLFVRLFYLHIKQGWGCPKKKKKYSQCANAMSIKKCLAVKTPQTKGNLD